MPSATLKSRIATQIRILFPRLWMERELCFRPNHFEQEFWLVPIFCDERKTAIDVGANMGLYSYFMAKFSKNVIAFEPNTDLWSDLRRLLGQDFHLEAAALSEKSAKATLRIDNSNTGVSTIEEKNQLVCVHDHTAVVPRVVETRTLDSFNISNVSMIKIDVEGHEEAVISGARKTIEINRPVLIIESEDRHNPGAPSRLTGTLAELGYLAFYLKNQQLMEFSTLCSEDTDPENIDKRLPYINNFIYIPAEQGEKIERVQAFLSAGRSAKYSSHLSHA